MVSPPDPRFDPFGAPFGLLPGLVDLWADWTGAGVTVAVYGDGIAADHPDLAPNWLEAGWDPASDGRAFYWDHDGNPGTADILHDPTADPGATGTAVAGVIGAASNGIGSLGIAHGATLAAIDLGQLDAAGTLAAFAHGQAYDVVQVDIRHSADFASPDTAQTAALDTALVQGRGGLGTVLVQPGGQDSADANGEGLGAWRGSIAVGGTLPDGSAGALGNWGASLLITAPALAETTDLPGSAGFAPGDYATLGSTSLAAAAVSGTTALMLEAAPGLGWRDVQDILALSARQTGSLMGEGAAGFEQGAWIANADAPAAGSWNGGGTSFHLSYGYGRLDPLAATRMAEVWEQMRGPARSSANEISHSQTDSPALTLGSGTTTHTIAFAPPGPMHVEVVELSLTLAHPAPANLALTLIAPDGSEMPVASGAEAATPGWTFTLAGLRGVEAVGDWQLRIEGAGGSGALSDVTLAIHGAPASADSLHTITEDWAEMIAAQPIRAVLVDGDGGTDTLNMVTLRGDMRLDLAHDGSGGFGTAADAWGGIAAGTVIEQAFLGDGADAATGHDGGVTLSGGRGNDTLTGGAGDDLLLGGDEAGEMAALTAPVWAMGTGAATLLAEADAPGFDLSYLYLGPATQEVDATLPLRILRAEALDGTTWDLTGAAAHVFTLTAPGLPATPFLELTPPGGPALLIQLGGAPLPPGFDLDAASASGTRARIDGGAYGEGQAIRLDDIPGADVLITANGDTLAGGAGADTLVGGLGDDLLDGGAGTDIARYAGAQADYTLTDLGGDWRITGAEGTDILRGIEVASFADGTLDLAPNTAPVLSAAPLSLEVGEVRPLSQIVTVFDAEGDAPTRWQMWDSAGASNWVVDGAPLTTSGGFADDIADIAIRAADGPGVQTILLRAQDAEDWGDWLSLQLITTQTNTPPVAAVPTQRLEVGQSVALADILTATDAEGDAITRYQVWDSAGANNWALDGVALTGSGAIVSDLSRLSIVAADTPGVQTLQLRLDDGTDWGAWLPIQLVTSRGNTAPTLTIPDQRLEVGSTVALADITTINDPDGDVITRWQIWDSAGVNNWRVEGVAPSGSGQIVSNIDDISIAAADMPGVQTIQVRADDGTEWGAWEVIELVTTPPNGPPVLTVPTQRLEVGDVTPLADVITVSDPDGDPITRWQIWDSAGASNWVVDGTPLGVPGAIVTDLADIALAAATAPGVQTLQLRADDGRAWSAWTPLELVTTQPNTAPEIAVSDPVLEVGQQLALSDILIFTDADGDAPARWQLWDSAGDSNWLVDGAPLTGPGAIVDDLADIAIAAADAPGVQSIQVRANDGTDWSDWDILQLVTQAASGGDGAMA